MKKVTLTIIVVFLLVSLSACGGGAPTEAAVPADDSSAPEQSDDTTEPMEEPVEYDKIVVAFRTNTTVPSEQDKAKVEEAINKITREKIGAEVELYIVQAGSYVQQMQLMLSGNEQLDVVGVHLGFLASAIDSDALLDLADLLKEYGQGITDVLPEELLRSGKYAEGQFVIPILADTAGGTNYYILNKDIVDKYNIDVDAIDSFEALEAAFEIVHQNEPDMNIVAPRNAGASFAEFARKWDRLSDNFGVLDNYGDNLEVVNLFETANYREYIDRMTSWHEKGYISDDVATAAESGQEQMKAGTLFAYTHQSKPGVIQAEQLGTGTNLTGVALGDVFGETFTIWQWGIPHNTANAEKAMQFLNLQYTDPDVLNLMVYGIEGEDYRINENGTVGFPEGVDTSNVGYSVAGMTWSFGNEFNAYVWETNEPDIWEQTKKWNAEATYSKAYGFRWDSTPVANEIAACSNIYKEYNLSLENGLIASDQIDAVLEEMNNRLYDAGLQKIIDEKQRQLDEWAALNGVK